MERTAPVGCSRCGHGVSDGSPGRADRRPGRVRDRGLVARGVSDVLGSVADGALRHGSCVFRLGGSPRLPAGPGRPAGKTAPRCVGLRGSCGPRQGCRRSRALRRRSRRRGSRRRWPGGATAFPASRDPGCRGGSRGLVRGGFDPLGRRVRDPPRGGREPPSPRRGRLGGRRRRRAFLARVGEAHGQSARGNGAVRLALPAFAGGLAARAFRSRTGRRGPARALDRSGTRALHRGGAKVSLLSPAVDAGRGAARRALARGPHAGFPCRGFPSPFAEPSRGFGPRHRRGLRRDPRGAGCRRGAASPRGPREGPGGTPPVDRRIARCLGRARAADRRFGRSSRGGRNPREALARGGRWAVSGRSHRADAPADREPAAVRRAGPRRSGRRFSPVLLRAAGAGRCLLCAAVDSDDRTANGDATAVLAGRAGAVPGTAPGGVAAHRSVRGARRGPGGYEEPNGDPAPSDRGRSRRAHREPPGVRRSEPRGGESRFVGSSRRSAVPRRRAPERGRWRSPQPGEDRR